MKPTQSKKACVVSGASSGIGKHVAQRLLSASTELDYSEVIAIGRNDLKLKLLEASHTKEAITLKLLQLDQSNYHSNGHKLLQILRNNHNNDYSHSSRRLSSGQSSSIKYLVCSAGVCNNVGAYESLDFEKVVYELQTNLTGTMSMVHSALQNFDKSGGHIVLLSSPIGRIPTQNMAVYGATKAALINFAESLKQELYTKNIKVSCVLPTLVNTEMAVHSPSPLIWPIEAEYVAQQTIELIERGHSGIKTIGLQATAATVIQRFTPQINKWLTQIK